MKPEDFFQELKASSLPVVVDFWAPWCGPCRAIDPLMKKLDAQYQGQVKVWKINADEHPDVLRSLKVYGIPTLVAFKNGQEVARHTGAAALPALGRLFEAALSGEKPAGPAVSPLDRVLRLAAGGALFTLALQNQFSGLYLLLAVVAALVAFSAVYDRCPIYQALLSRLRPAKH